MGNVTALAVMSARNIEKQHEITAVLDRIGPRFIILFLTFFSGFLSGSSTYMIFLGSVASCMCFEYDTSFSIRSSSWPAKKSVARHVFSRINARAVCLFVH